MDARMVVSGGWRPPRRADRSARTEGGGTGAREPSRPGLRVLVVGTDDWAIEQAAAELAAGSCQVLRCHEPGQPAFPCNALVEGRTCPIDAGFDVVADLRARPAASLSQSEFGVVCALHHGRPLVVAGVAPEVPLGPWAAQTVGHGGSLVEACEAAAAGGARDTGVATPETRGAS